MRLFDLDGGQVKLLLPAPIRIAWSCHCCPHPVSAVSDDALKAAMDDHARYVNATVDRTTDPHFAEHRLDALIRG